MFLPTPRKPGLVLLQQLVKEIQPLSRSSHCSRGAQGAEGLIWFCKTLLLCSLESG